MESKTAYALLLSIIVMTGAMTTGAFAQSTSGKVGIIYEVYGTISGIISEIGSTIESLVNGVDSILSEITMLVTNLDSADVGVAGMSDAITDLNNTVSGLEGDIRDMDANMTRVQEKVDSINSAITPLDDIMTDVVLLDVKIDNLETALTDDDMIDDVVANTKKINSLSARALATDDSIMATLNEIQDRLEAISASLVTVSENVDRQAASAGSTDEAFKSYSEYKVVSTYDFARLGKMVDERGYVYYDLEMNFICNEDVRLEKAVLIQTITGENQFLNRGAVYDGTVTNPQPFPGTDSHPERGANYVRIQSTSIYHNWYPINPVTVIEFNHDADFDSKLLKAGDTVPFDARLYDGMFIIKNDTSKVASLDVAGNIVTDDAIKPYLNKIVDNGDTPYRDVVDNNGNIIADSSSVEIHEDHLEQLIEKDRTKAKDLYTIRVDWLSTTGGTQCHIDFGPGSDIASYTKEIRETFVANIIDQDDVLRQFDTTLDCAGDPVQIISIQAAPAPATEWEAEFEDYADIHLTILDGKDDDTPDAEYRFAKNGEVTLLEGDDFLEFRNAELRIHGQLPPKIETLVVTLDLKSIENAECTLSATP